MLRVILLAKCSKYLLSGKYCDGASKGKVLLRYIQSSKEQQKIVLSSHIDPTSGHMGKSRTLFRIKERFMWHGMVKDVNNLIFMRMGLPHVVVSDNGREFDNKLNDEICKTLGITPYHPQPNLPIDIEMQSESVEELVKHYDEMVEPDHGEKSKEH
eukprot:Em0009g558a